jgi:hypothetical protein
VEGQIYRWEDHIGKIGDAKYKFYEYFDSTQQDDYNEKLNELRATLKSVEKEWHHWACYDQGDHGSEESKKKKSFYWKDTHNKNNLIFI